MVSHFLTETAKYVFAPLDGDNIHAILVDSDIAEMVKNSYTELKLTDANVKERVVWNPEAFKTKVLIRDRDGETWFAAIFSHRRTDKLLYSYCIVGTQERFKQCIPYEGNEHLLGTRDMPEKEYVIEGTEVDKAEENPSGTDIAPEKAKE